jgi:hypothetical protein
MPFRSLFGKVENHGVFYKLKKVSIPILEFCAYPFETNLKPVFKQ